MTVLLVALFLFTVFCCDVCPTLNYNRGSSTPWLEQWRALSSLFLFESLYIGHVTCLADLTLAICPIR